MKFVVYDPPVLGLPFLAVALHADNTFAHVEACGSAHEAEKMIEHLAQQVATKVAGEGAIVRQR